MIAGGIWRVVQYHHIPLMAMPGQLSLQPLGLDGIGAETVGLTIVAVEDVKLHRPLLDRIIALVAWKAEVIEVGLALGAHHVVIAERREETIGRLARGVRATVRVDVLTIGLPDVGIDRLSRAYGVIVIAYGNDKIGLPTLDQRRHFSGIGRGVAEIADDGKSDGRIRLRRGWCRRQAQQREAD